jgi:hypothetical protein
VFRRSIASREGLLDSSCEVDPNKRKTVICSVDKAINDSAKGLTTAAAIRDAADSFEGECPWMPELDPGEVVIAWRETEAPCPERWSASNSESENFPFTDSVDLDGSKLTAVFRNPS